MAGRVYLKNAFHGFEPIPENVRAFLLEHLVQYVLRSVLFDCFCAFQSHRHGSALHVARPPKQRPTQTHQPPCLGAAPENAEMHPLKTSVGVLGQNRDFGTNKNASAAQQRPCPPPRRVQEVESNGNGDQTMWGTTGSFPKWKLNLTAATRVVTGYLL